MTTQSYEVQDRVRKIKFTGDQIGHSTTRGQGSTRWTEITIYRTVGGQYVIQREGKSLRYHLPRASCASGEPMTADELLDEEIVIDGMDMDPVPCPDCKPPTVDELVESGANPMFRREVTMSSVDVTPEPEKIVRILTYKGRLAMVATEAIEQAMHNDERLRGIYSQVETIA